MDAKITNSNENKANPVNYSTQGFTGDPLIAKYREVHDEEHVWKEVIEGIRKVGILEMEIYIAGTHLVMIVDTALDFDWNTAMAKLATLPRQAEWEAFVSEFQGCAKDATSDEKWQLMDRMFKLY